MGPHLRYVVPLTSCTFFTWQKPTGWKWAFELFHYQVQQRTWVGSRCWGTSTDFKETPKKFWLRKVVFRNFTKYFWQWTTENPSRKMLPKVVSCMRHVNLRMKRTPRPYHDREICYCCCWMTLQQICRFSVLVEADAITTIALPANFDLWQRDWRTAFERYAKELNVFVGTVGQNK